MELIEDAYAAGGDDITNVRLLEDNIRDFLRSGDEFERGEGRNGDFADQGREDYFSNCEIESLALIRNLKKIPESKEKLKSESLLTSQTEEAKGKEKV